MNESENLDVLKMALGNCIIDLKEVINMSERIPFLKDVKEWESFVRVVQHDIELSEIILKNC